MPASPDQLDTAAFAYQEAMRFGPSIVTGASSGFPAACEKTLLIAQAIAAVVIVAAMISRMRKDAVQMEGIASIILKVAFISTIPFWSERVQKTADAMAEAIGYSTTVGSNPSPDHPQPRTVFSFTWALLSQWAPPGSPYLDALEAQAGNSKPASGDEEAWALRSWNWARGVGTATGDMIDWLWQSFSGGLRATIVLICCAVMVCLLSLVIVLMHFSELLRIVLFHGGCALAPVAIAALGIESFRSTATRFLLGLTAIAFWPVGWALCGLITYSIVGGTLFWMMNTVHVALQIPQNSTPPAFAVAAPYLGWATLFLFMGVTLAVCLWILATFFAVPVMFSRLMASASHWTSTSIDHLRTTASETRTVEIRSTVTVPPSSSASPAAPAPYALRTPPAAARRIRISG